MYVLPQSGGFKCLENSELQTRSDAAATSLKKRKQLNQMLFLRDTLGNRKTESKLEAAFTTPSPTNLFPPLQSSFNNEGLETRQTMWRQHF